MLHLYLFLLFTLFFITSANPDPAIKTSSPGAVYYCKGQNFSGDCHWYPPDAGCILFGQGNELNEQAHASFGPNPGGYCEFYLSEGRRGPCEGEARTIQGLPDSYVGDRKKLRYPGLNNSRFPMWYESMRCFKD